MLRPSSTESVSRARAFFTTDAIGWLVRAAWLVTAGFTTALLVHSARTGCFWGDDLTTFRHALGPSLLKAAVIPLGSQIVPLHRAVTFLVYFSAPMQWVVVVVLLGAFHVAGIVLLYRVLELLRASRANPVIVALYATHPLAGLQFMWFSSGLTRAPYTMLSLFAMLSYLRVARRTERRDAPLALLALFLAFGFYTKAALIPLYCIGVDFAARGVVALKDRRCLRVVSLMLVLVVAVVLGVRVFQDWGSRTMNLNLGYQVLFVKRAGNVFLHSLVDSVQTYGNYHPKIWVPALFGMIAIGTSFRARGAHRAWVVMAALVVANLLVVATSNRTILWGEYMPFELRHFYEICFIVAVLAGVVVHSHPEDAIEARWLAPRPRKAAAAVVMSALLFTHAARAHRAFREVAPLFSEPRACLFLSRLTQGLARVPPRPTPRFVDGQFPLFLDGLDFSFRKYSELLPVLRFHAAFSPEGDYRVTDQGTVLRVRRRRP